jgi:hypothetical protein
MLLLVRTEAPEENNLDELNIELQFLLWWI